MDLFCLTWLLPQVLSPWTWGHVAQGVPYSNAFSWSRALLSLSTDTSLILCWNLPGLLSPLLHMIKNWKAWALGTGPCWCSQKLLCILCSVAHTFGGKWYFLAGSNNLQVVIWCGSQRIPKLSWIRNVGVWLVILMLFVIVWLTAVVLIVSCYRDLFTLNCLYQSSVTLWFSSCKLCLWLFLLGASGKRLMTEAPQGQDQSGYIIVVDHVEPTWLN